jgi:hypothetical protein
MFIYRCPTLLQAKEITDTAIFTKPKTIILHCGTNDMEKSAENSKIYSEMLNVADTITKKYPECKIISCPQFSQEWIITIIV